MRESDITPFLHTRWFFLIAMLMAVGGTAFAFMANGIDYLTDNYGFVFPSANEWIPDRWWSLCANLVLYALCALALTYINKGFNVIRYMTWLFTSLFVIIQGACPSLTGQFYDGTVLCMAVLLAIIPLFLSFQNPKDTGNIFIIFCLLSFGTLSDVAYAGYLAVFMLGCLQMQCLKFKGCLALLLGIVTPYWIIFGSGIAGLDSLRWPEFNGIFSVNVTLDTVPLLVYAGLTMALGIVASILNLIKVYSYNARTRAYNGFFLILFLFSCLLAVVDYKRMIVYLPIVNMGSAFQIGHFFVINNQKRSYIPVLAITAAYCCIYWWNILV